MRYTGRILPVISAFSSFLLLSVLASFCIITYHSSITIIISIGFEFIHGIESILQGHKIYCIT